MLSRRTGEVASESCHAVIRKGSGTSRTSGKIASHFRTRNIHVHVIFSHTKLFYTYLSFSARSLHE